MSVRDFAERLGIAIRTVSEWENRGADITLQPTTQSMLDVALQGQRQRLLDSSGS